MITLTPEIIVNRAHRGRLYDKGERLTLEILRLKETATSIWMGGKFWSLAPIKYVGCWKLRRDNRFFVEQNGKQKIKTEIERTVLPLTDPIEVYEAVQIKRKLVVPRSWRYKLDPDERIKPFIRLDRIDKKYSIEEVLDHPSMGKNVKAIFDGDLINMRSLRYKVFKVKGTVCVTCGLVGTHFYKERHFADHRYHFNLYGINKHGREIMMTKDHIIAIANGGSKMSLTNLQPMCYNCNQRKGDKR